MKEKLELLLLKFKLFFSTSDFEPIGKRRIWQSIAIIAILCFFFIRPKSDKQLERRVDYLVEYHYSKSKDIATKDDVKFMVMSRIDEIISVIVDDSISLDTVGDHKILIWNSY